MHQRGELPFLSNNPESRFRGWLNAGLCGGPRFAPVQQIERGSLSGLLYCDSIRKQNVGEVRFPIAAVLANTL